MERHPFLPALHRRDLFTVGDPEGAKFVQVTPGPYAPLHSYQNTSAAPFYRHDCECGVLNPDATCVTATSALTQPFVPQKTSGAEWEFSSPFELLGTQR